MGGGWGGGAIGVVGPHTPPFLCASLLLRPLSPPPPPPTPPTASTAHGGSATHRGTARSAASHFLMVQRPPPPQTTFSSHVAPPAPPPPPARHHLGHNECVQIPWCPNQDPDWSIHPHSTCKPQGVCRVCALQHIPCRYLFWTPMHTLGFVCVEWVCALNRFPIRTLGNFRALIVPQVCAMCVLYNAFENGYPTDSHANPGVCMCRVGARTNSLVYQPEKGCG